MSLENLKIWVSPMTHIVYAGYARGNSVTSKIDITEQVISAVAEHLDLEQCRYEMGAGTLMLVKDNFE